MKIRKHILFEEENNDPEWVVVYHLGYSEFDDDMLDDNTEEIIINAINFDVAVKYAQQYLKKMQTEEETADRWQNAQILSLDLR